MNMPSAAMQEAMVREITPRETANSRPDSFIYAPIAQELEQAEQIFQLELDTRAPYVSDLITHLGHYRGKRLRPTLLLLTAKACGGVKSEHLKLAAVVEMIHTATLVHDDVLDSADMRRHVATINARWGNASSVLLGDLLFTHAFHLASKTGSAYACQMIGEATNKVCEGELRQIGEQGNLNLTEEDYYSIIDGKTAALTACCSELGAHFAGSNAATIAAMKSFGSHLGIAFQVADDVLDLMGNESVAGKSLGTDVLQKKLTLPLIHLLRQGNSSSDQAKEILESPDAEGMLQLRQLLEESDSIRYAQQQAEQHVQRARELLQKLPRSLSAQTLDAIMLRIIHRSS